MKTLKAVIVERHIGAVLVGFTLAQGVTTLAGLLLIPVTNGAMRLMRSGEFRDLPPIFPPGDLLITLARAVVYLAVGLLLLKLLYLSNTPEVVEETNAESDQEEDTQDV